MMTDTDQKPDSERRHPGLWSTAKSVFSAFLGVQSRKNWEEDMKSPSPAQFMIVGTIMGFGLVILLGVITWFITVQLTG